MLLPKSETIVLAGGCFWCLDAVYSQVRGVMSVESGYANGHLPQPSYEQVCTGMSGHAEVVRVEFDTRQISLHEILQIFFVIHDPTTLNFQGHDHGTQYRSGIFFLDVIQRDTAQGLLQELKTSGVYQRPIVTELAPLASYWPAEDYHQDFFARNPNHGYCLAVAVPKVDKFRKTFARLLSKPS